MRQSKEYNCGIFAALRLLERYGIKDDPDRLEKLVGCTPESGTPGEGIMAIFASHGIKFVAHKNTSIETLSANLPAIVNFMHGTEGHYGVAENIFRGHIHIWDPWLDEIISFPLAKFDGIWYSERYGKRWFLHPLLTKN